MNDAKTHARMLLAASLLLACGGSDGGGVPTDPNEPNDTFAEATPITIGMPVVAAISSLQDLDYYVFTVPAGGASVRFQTFDAGGAGCGSRVDPLVWVYDGTQSFETVDDDSWGDTYCEDFTWLLAEGPNYVEVEGWVAPFGYTLVVTIP